jgi:hypothetical protein
MRKSVIAGLALWALFAASGKAHADVNDPLCLMGDTTGYECVFSSREQCGQDGRDRGFGSHCIQNLLTNRDLRPFQVRSGPKPHAPCRL